MRAEGNAHQPLRLIVSGGMGSGKSTVLGLMKLLGAVVIEADRIGHQVLEPDGPAFAQVAARWPGVVGDGRINRRLLANIVFSDPEQLAELEAMTHPHIGEVILRRAQQAGERTVVVELPVAADLLGPGWTKILVAVPEQVRIERAVARGEEVADVVRRTRSQPTDAEWAAHADHVLPNTGTEEELEAAVVVLWRRLHGQA
jgi:dephospho-CoA kinase